LISLRGRPDVVVARNGRLLNVYLPEDLARRLEESAERNHRTKTMQVVLALEQFLEADGAATEVKPKQGGKGRS
jgi:hypothetical protein